VNELCRGADRAPIYSDVDQLSAVTTSIRADEFYGKPLASVVRTILEKRAAAGLFAAQVNDIYEAMQRGGYKFDAKNDDNAKRGLYVSLGKNTSMFHKLPNGTYGLLEWYPAVKESKAKSPNGDQKESAEKGKEKPLHEELQAEAAGDEQETEELAGAKGTKAK
jgi:hypothetical protein